MYMVINDYLNLKTPSLQSFKRDKIEETFLNA